MLASKWKLRTKQIQPKTNCSESVPKNWDCSHALASEGKISFFGILSAFWDFIDILDSCYVDILGSDWCGGLRSVAIRGELCPGMVHPKRQLLPWVFGKGWQVFPRWLWQMLRLHGLVPFNFIDSLHSLRTVWLDKAEGKEWKDRTMIETHLLSLYVLYVYCRFCWLLYKPEGPCQQLWTVATVLLGGWRVGRLLAEIISGLAEFFNRSICHITSGCRW